MIDYKGRCSKVREVMADHQIDYLLVPPSSDLVYLTGYVSRQSERLTLFVLSSQGEHKLLMPSFEVPRAEKLASFFEIVTWTETENPVEILASLFPDHAMEKTIAVGGQLHSSFLLRIQEAIPGAEYVEGGLVIDQVRMRKSAYEIIQLSAASSSADAVFEELITLPLVGMSEKEILSNIHELLIVHGHNSVGGGIVGAGPNSASPHHHASNRTVSRGDAVVIDYGGELNGYRSDMTRTLHAGAPTDEFRRIYEIVNEANQRAFETVAIGVPAENVDAAARDHIKAAGFGPQFLHRTGHGIGLDGHEPPYIVAGDKTILDEGMVFSIEPGIYLQGKFGIRIEDIVVVTQEGPQRLNNSTHLLQIIE